MLIRRSSDHAPKNARIDYLPNRFDYLANKSWRIANKRQVCFGDPQHFDGFDQHQVLVIVFQLVPVDNEYTLSTETVKQDLAVGWQHEQNASFCAQGGRHLVVVQVNTQCPFFVGTWHYVHYVKSGRTLFPPVCSNKICTTVIFYHRAQNLQGPRMIRNGLIYFVTGARICPARAPRESENQAPVPWWQKKGAGKNRLHSSRRWIDSPARDLRQKAGQGVTFSWTSRGGERLDYVFFA